MNTLVAATAAVAFCLSAVAQTPTITHNPAGGLPGGGVSPANPFAGATTERFPALPREGESVRIYFKVCCQFGYDRVALYYTKDGSEPQGSLGVGSGSTQALTSAGGQVSFVANDFNTNPGVRDWWVATLPASTRGYAQNIRYKMSRWNDAQGAASQFFNDGASTSNGAPAISFANKLAWPGQGSAFVGSEGVGYPPVHFWKEEAMAGNGYINAMYDQNGSWWDLYYPGAGGAFGVGTKNEGYADGIDTFPPGTSGRGQMHLNTMMIGVRADGVTSWLSNQTGTDFANVSQSWLGDTNIVRTTQNLVRNGNNLHIEQTDFAPDGVTYPTNGGTPLRGILVKRLVLTNNGPSTKTVNVYLYMDPAINGGDGFDSMYTDASRGTIIAYDNAGGSALSRGEYNPRSDGIDYPKNVSVYLAATMKRSPAVGAAGGIPAADFWSDTSGDVGQGWVGQQVTLEPGVPVEFNFAITGGFDNFAAATGTYNFHQAPLIDWFMSNSGLALQNATAAYWANWLATGTTIDFPDDSYDNLFKRGLLGTALHIDRKGGGVVAGYHNGAYYYVWPRDAAWAGVTLARTGHFDEAKGVLDWLRDVAYRDFENWGDVGPRKGFWKQKYTTDGHVVWFAAQVDETAVVPWLVKYHHDITNDTPLLITNYVMSFDAGIAMTRTSINEPARLNFQSGVNLMFSNNIWEDSNDVHLFSNANIVRGVRDLYQVALRLGYNGDLGRWQSLDSTFTSGVNGRIDWNGENTDISHLGVTYPFDVIPANDSRAALLVNRINGVAQDRFGQTKPLVNFASTPGVAQSGWTDLLDRYHGDGYWNGPQNNKKVNSPWFLSTLWYGGYYAMRNEFTADKGDIDNHKYRIDLTKNFNGPMGFGAEQMAPFDALMYPGQSEFRLQTAWPNAWESMSFYVDALMMFLDYRPDAQTNTLRIRPKLPTGWPSMTFRNVRLGNDPAAPERSHSVDIIIDESGYYGPTHTIINNSGNEANFDTVVRVASHSTVCNVQVNSIDAAFTYDPELGRVAVQGAITPGTGAATVIRALARPFTDYNRDGSLNPDDLGDFITDYYTVPHPAGPDGYAIPCPANVAPYDRGYKANFVPGCGEPNPDQLGDFITAYFAVNPCM
ncbi:MAG: hypothetical protein ACKVS8_02615 [Phycisphaerales bacterium]